MGKVYKEGLYKEEDTKDFSKRKIYFDLLIMEEMEFKSTEGYHIFNHQILMIKSLIAV